MGRRKLWIVGAGGHGSEVLNGLREVVAAGTHEVRFADSNPTATTLLGTPVHHSEEIAAGDLFTIAIGSGAAREAIHNLLTAKGAGPFLFRAPTAVVGLGVTTGDGAALLENTLLTANIQIGRQFQCNMYSYVAHDCVIGDYVTFAPRVSCNGNIEIGDYAYIGTGAVLRQGNPGKPLRIGVGAVVGMGAVVTRDVPDGVTVVGNPARILER